MNSITQGLERNNTLNCQSFDPNLTFASALYYVDVTTADDEWGTGTDADVLIQIFGVKGNTSAVELTKSGNLFESGK